MSEQPPTSQDSASTPERPLLRVVNPDATPEEVAALVAVFSALGSGEVPAPRPPRAWSNPARLVRQSARHGHGGWRASGLPRG